MAEALNVVVDADGIATATMDSPGRSMNVLDDDLAGPLAALIERLAADASIKGLILASGKQDFLAGADVDRLSVLASAQEAFDESMRFKKILRQMELGGKPVVAAINGKCLGGGMGIATIIERI